MPHGRPFFLFFFFTRINRRVSLRSNDNYDPIGNQELSETLNWSGVGGGFLRGEAHRLRLWKTPFLGPQLKLHLRFPPLCVLSVVLLKGADRHYSSQHTLNVVFLNEGSGDGLKKFSFTLDNIKVKVFLTSELLPDDTLLCVRRQKPNMLKTTGLLILINKLGILSTM